MKWIMIQYTDQIISEEGFPMYGLMMMTDISHLKYNGQSMMSILNTEDETCQIFYCSEKNEISTEEPINHKITARETEVLTKLTKGLSSKQIADQLDISINTVSTHRQNMLLKTGSKSTGELVNFDVKMGLV